MLAIWTARIVREATRQAELDAAAGVVDRSAVQRRRCAKGNGKQRHKRQHRESAQQPSA
jgi:hypothetical protein